jgi:hypothetical protein
MLVRSFVTFFYLFSEELKDSPEKISRLLSQKNYLEATKALVLALDNLNGELKNVDGLIEVREVLEAKKEVGHNQKLFCFTRCHL